MMLAIKFAPQVDLKTEEPVSIETPKPRLRVGAATPAVAEQGSGQGSISDALTALTTEPGA